MDVVEGGGEGGGAVHVSSVEAERMKSAQQHERVAGMNVWVVSVGVGEQLRVELDSKV